MISDNLLTRAVGKHDVRNPVFEDHALFGVQSFEFKAHAEASVAVDDSGFSVESTRVADDLDGDGGPDAVRGQGVHVASADA
jgi:hypothetical protein